MTGKLDWKWIAIGVVIMVVLTIVAMLIMAPLMVSQMENAASAEVGPGGGMILLMLAVNILVFLIGGFIVGRKSAGRTILEPGISALIAVIIGLLLTQTFTLGNLVLGGLLPFAAGVLGGWLGDRRQAAAA
jgi:small-conductance mechanosensitive channel